MVQGGADADFPEAAVEPVEVLLEPVDTTGVDGQDLVDGVAKQEAAVQGGYARLGQGQESPVQPGDFAGGAHLNRTRP
jgi:hypothetical protein